MSFLNPVNEPVLRFKSTDAGAPQINYNARTAGDVKAVLKACLVTGYGAKASAGWSIANEVNHVAEFVSPAAAMSDYRLGIDDTSAASTTWYYQYQDARVNPSYNKPIKSLYSIDGASINNGWQMLVTPRGIMFIELVLNTIINKVTARLTHFSQVKSGLLDSSGQNMMFFNIGHSSTIDPQQLYAPNFPHFRLKSHTSAQLLASTPFVTPTLTSYANSDDSVMDIASELYACNPNRSVMLCQVVGLLSKVVNKQSDLYAVSEQTVSNRPVLSICCGFTSSAASDLYTLGRTFLIYLDYWEF